MAQDPPNLTLLIKLLRMTASSNDGEALIAMRKANELLAKFGGDWDTLLRGKVTIIADPFGDLPDVKHEPKAPPVPMPPRQPQPVPKATPPWTAKPPRPQSTTPPQYYSKSSGNWSKAPPPQPQPAYVNPNPRRRRGQKPSIDDLLLP